jgi:NAD(P)-dependent dehydrogenase (short-subunit alcohol dehydrogenase family)
MNRLQGKVVVINGGTKGVGRAIAVAVASEGAFAVIGGRNEVDGQGVVAEIKDRYAIDSVFVQGDVSNVQACENLIRTGAGRFGRIDGLVNYTGILPICPLLGTDEELFDKIFDTNFKSAFYCTRFAMEEMLKIGGGSIVNMGSLHAYSGEKDRAAYACSKAAMLALTKHIAKNYATDRIRSNWITMGWVATPGEMDLRKSQGKGIEWLEETARAVIPMGRMQTDEDNVHGVIYLLSDESSQVTGAEIPITGGLTL